MNKPLYNSLTTFAKEALKDIDIKIGFIISADYSVKVIDNETNVDLKKMQEYVDGYIEVVSYIKDDNFDVIVDEEGINKNKRFNMLAYLTTGYQLYGDVLILKKGILK